MREAFEGILAAILIAGMLLGAAVIGVLLIIFVVLF